MQPPVARKIPHTHMIHGDKREDPYFWMRERDSDEVLEYLEAENAFTDANMAHTAEFQERLFEEIKGHIKQDDESVPQVDLDGWWYFTRRVEEKQYPIILRKPTRDSTEEHVLMDVNELGDEHEFVSLGDFEIPTGTSKLWYTVDLSGYRQYELRCRDLETGDEVCFKDSPDSIFGRITTFEFVEGRNDAIWFTVEDEDTKRSHQVYFWVLSESPRLIYEEKDERFNVGLSMSSDRTAIIMTSGSHTTTETYFADSDSVEGRLMLLYPRRQDIECYADRRNGRWYSMSNEGGRNFEILVGGEVLVPHDPEAIIEGMTLFKNHLVYATRKEGISSILVARFEADAVMEGEPRAFGIHPPQRVEFPEEAIDCGLGTNNLYDTDVIRVGYQSMVTAGVTYDCDLETLDLHELKRTEVLGGYEQENYVSERFHATAPDGEKIPITISRHVNTPVDGTAPMLLIGYGSYGLPYSIYFSHMRLLLLDRGFVFGIAHIRGGSEKGKRWHDEGRMFNKMNTFTDFIACAEHLIAKGYSAPDKLCIEGGSAGGLLVAAVTNMRPDLFRVVTAQVPFVDVLTTMLDNSMPLVVAEYEEWGDPHQAESYAYMKTYCPITNVAAKDYPTMLVRTSYNDSQVMFWEPAKYVAKLRDLKTDDNLLLFKCLMDDAGHGGKSGRYDAYRDAAFDYAFLFDQFGITE